MGRWAALSSWCLESAHPLASSGCLGSQVPELLTSLFTPFHSYKNISGTVKEHESLMTNIPRTFQKTNLFFLAETVCSAGRADSQISVCFISSQWRKAGRLFKKCSPSIHLLTDQHLLSTYQVHSIMLWATETWMRNEMNIFLALRTMIVRYAKETSSACAIHVWAVKCEDYFSKGFTGEHNFLQKDRINLFK